MLVIVLLGLYWEGQRVPRESATDNSTEPDVKTPEIDSSDWDVSPEATVRVQTDNRVDSPGRTGQFDIPGRAKFPDGKQAEEVRLEVEVLPLDQEHLNRIETTPSTEDEPALTQLESPDSLREKAFTKTVTTDENGRFSLRDAPTGIYRIRSRDENWTGETEEPIVQHGTTSTPLQVSLRQSATLVGRVLDQDSQPLSNARVALTTHSHELRTDPEGQFRLNNLIPGQPINNAKITKQGFKTYYLDQGPLQPGEIRQDTFVLQRSASLSVVVQNSTGQPITDGKIRLRRISSGQADGDINARNSLMKSLDDNGVTEFNDVAPGRFKVSLAFSSYLADPLTVRLEPGESVRKTVTVREGKPVAIRHVNAETGETIDEVRPRITAYAGPNQPLDQGFKFKEIRSNGVIVGVVHPSTQKLIIRSESNRFEPEETTVRSTDLPDVKIPLSPSQTGAADQEPPGLLKVNLAVDGRFDWENVVDVQAYVLDGKTGQRILGRAGQRSVFQEPFPLKPGSYVLYGLIKTNSGSFALAQSLGIEGQHPGQKSLTPSRTGSVSGRVLLNEQPISETVRVAVSLLPPEDETQKSTRDIYYPEQLSTTPNANGEFTIDNVPTDRSLGLHVISEGSSTLGVQPGAVLTRISLEALSEGEERSVRTIKLQE